MATFGAILLVLAAVFVVLLLVTGKRVTQGVSDSLEATQRTFDALEQRRQRRTVIQATAIAESPGLTAALGQPDPQHGSVIDSSPVLQKELDRLAARLDLDALTVVSPDGDVIASAGPRRAAWNTGDEADTNSAALPAGSNERIVRRPTGLFRTITVPLLQHGAGIGTLFLSTALDDAYARELSALTRSHVAIMLDRELLGTTLGGQARQQLLTRGVLLPERGEISLGDEQFLTRRVLSLGAVQFVALESIDVSANQATRNAMLMLALVGIGALVLGGVASYWLAISVAVFAFNLFGDSLRDALDPKLRTL